MVSNYVKLVIFVPETHADAVREALGAAGAGAVGNYTHCTFSTKGVGRFVPTADAKPAIGMIGEFEQVQEERIETICPRGALDKVITMVRDVHPYEAIAMDIYPLESMPRDLL
jgi:hypothetical protein